MSRFLKIGEAARILGASVQTLRRWETDGTLIPDRKSNGGTRYYSEVQIFNKKTTEQEGTLAYARVSSHDQKTDLQTQVDLLTHFCAARGWKYEVISDLGSGMNYKKKGLKKVIDAILGGTIKRLVITHRDRLLRFGAELIFSLCEAKEIEVVIVNQGPECSFEEELVKDVLEIITVFSARLYGARSKKNKKLVDAAKLLMET